MSIREYKEKVKPNSRKDSLSILIATKDEDGSVFSHEELVSLASIFLVAGLIPKVVSLTRRHRHDSHDVDLCIL
jgi:cytochrome P450